MNILTTENMSKYIGGQIEIIGSDRYRYRGQISKIEIQPVPEPEVRFGQDATLCVECEYICEWQDNGYKPAENKPYLLSLLICTTNDIGSGRLCINSRILRETVVFYPPDHNRHLLPDGNMKVKT